MGRVGGARTKGGASDHPPVTLSPPCSPDCLAMWGPLVLMLLLLSLSPVPPATAAPIPHARAQDSQNLPQGPAASG